MKYVIDRLDGARGDLFVDAFRAIPINCTELDLIRPNLGIQTESDLCDAFKFIPDGVSHLHLDYESVGIKTKYQLKKVFARCPESITEVTYVLDVLNYNQKNLDDYFTYPIYSWLTDLQGGVFGISMALPVALEFLMRNLLIITYERLSNALGSLPESVKTVNISTLDLIDSITGDFIDGITGFCHALKALPVTVNKIAFTDTEHLSELEIKTILKSLPIEVSSLGLSDSNGFIHCRLKNIYPLPPQITELCLTNTRCYNNMNQSLVYESLTTIPDSIKSLDLSNNTASDITPETLRKTYNSIPNSVTKVNLSNSGFNTKNMEDLEIAFGGLPSSVTVIDLSGNGFDELSDSQLIPLIEVLAQHVTTLILNKRLMDTKLTQLVVKLEALLKKPNEIDFITMINPSFLIDEAQMNRLIKVCQQTNTKESLLISGLLYEGRIPFNEEDEKEPSPEVLEARMRHAIEIYIGLANSKDHNKASNFAKHLLWDIRTTDERPFVQELLGSMDLKPSKIFAPTYGKRCWSSNRFFEQPIESNDQKTHSDINNENKGP